MLHSFFCCFGLVNQRGIVFYDPSSISNIMGNVATPHMLKENLNCWILPDGTIYQVECMEHKDDIPAPYTSEEEAEKFCVKISYSMWSGIYVFFPKNLNKYQKSKVRKLIDDVQVLGESSLVFDSYKEFKRWDDGEEVYDEIGDDYNHSIYNKIVYSVCEDYHALEIVDSECTCVYKRNYDTILKAFLKCKHCNSII